jgi:hypothetical protein
VQHPMSSTLRAPSLSTMARRMAEAAHPSCPPAPSRPIPSHTLPNHNEKWWSITGTGGQLILADNQLECPGEAKLLGAPGRIRTYDTRFRKPLLYPLSYGSEWQSIYRGEQQGPGSLAQALPQ